MQKLAFLLFFLVFTVLTSCNKYGCPATEAIVKEQQNIEKGKYSKPAPLFGPDQKYKKKK